MTVCRSETPLKWYMPQWMMSTWQLPQDLVSLGSSV